MRYRIVRRTTNNQLQKRLLAEPKLTFKKALELAQAQESADQGSQQLQQQQQKHSLAPLNKIDRHCRPLLPPQTVTQANLATNVEDFTHRPSADSKMLSVIHATKHATFPKLVGAH